MSALLLWRAQGEARKPNKGRIDFIAIDAARAVGEAAGRRARDDKKLLFFDVGVAGCREQLDFNCLQVEHALQPAENGVIDLSPRAKLDELLSLSFDDNALRISKRGRPLSGGGPAARR